MQKSCWLTTICGRSKGHVRPLGHVEVADEPGGHVLVVHFEEAVLRVVWSVRWCPPHAPMEIIIL